MKELGIHIIQAIKIFLIQVKKKNLIIENIAESNIYGLISNNYHFSYSRYTIDGSLPCHSWIFWKSPTYGAVNSYFYKSFQSCPTNHSSFLIYDRVILFEGLLFNAS